MPDIASLDAAARRLRELHQIGRPLILVNVWDPAGARAVVAAGSPAVATSSVAMAGARGGTDSNHDRVAAMDEVLRRARLYVDAGVDCVYPISLRDPALVAQVVKELDSPVNVNPSDPLAALASAGAARISLGGGVHNWMMRELERRARRLFDGDGTAFA